MKSSFTCIAVIPAYNPGEIVCSVVSRVAAAVDAVILVDDGCDETNKAFLDGCLDYGDVTLVSFPENRGKGFALFAGIREAAARLPDYILTIDSDGQHDAADIARFREYVETAAAPPDLLIGTRERIDEMPLRSRIGNVFTAKIFTYIFGKRLPDTQSGFRLLSASFARDLLEHVAPGRYETEMKMLIHAVGSNRTVVPIPTGTLYLDGNRNSKFRPVQDSLRVLTAFARYAVVGLASFVVDYGIFLALTYAAGINYIYAHGAARICSGVFNFACNKFLVFRSQGRMAPEALKYFLTALFSLAATTAILYFFVDTLHLPRAVAKPAADCSVFILNFTILSLAVFRDGERHG